MNQPLSAISDQTENILKSFKSFLLTPDELSRNNSVKSSEFLPCDKCKSSPSQKLPCNHCLCEKCIEEKSLENFVITCLVCGIELKYTSDISGFFVCQWEEKPHSSSDNNNKSSGKTEVKINTKIEIRMFSEDDKFLNFQFILDYPDGFIKGVTNDIFLKKYFSILKKSSFELSNVLSSPKEKIFLRVLPKAINKPIEEEFKVSKEGPGIIELCKAAKLYPINKEILMDSNGRSKQPIIVVPGSFLPEKSVNVNLGHNVMLIRRLLERLAAEECDPSLSNNMISSVENITTELEQNFDQLSVEPELPLKCKKLARFSYKTLVSSLYQAPCNEFEEKIMQSQKSKDFTNPIFCLNTELISQAKEIADSLTVKATSTPIESLPKCDDFSFDLYHQIKCNKYRYCGQCRQDYKKEKILYSYSADEILDEDRKYIATYKCLNCKEYLCPTCAH